MKKPEHGPWPDLEDHIESEALVMFAQLLPILHSGESMLATVSQVARKLDCPDLDKLQIHVCAFSSDLLALS